MSFDLENPICRLAIVSDLHAFSNSKKADDSSIDLSSSPLSSSNPLTDLLSFAKRKNLTSDVLVCAGDICNKADFSGLANAWGLLHKLRGELSADHLITTCGNHDLDSRYLHDDTDPDPKGALLALDPPFPFDEEELTNKFWARNYAIKKISDSLLVINVNTSAYHGGVPAEIDHGRISRRTIDSIVRDIKEIPPFKAYVLLCHHHPLPMQGWSSRGDDGEFLTNGQELMDALTIHTQCTWLIIHGHRHIPRLIHAASSSSVSPIVLGAASLGARMVGASNQFHLVSLFACDQLDCANVVGTVKTWSWTESAGWSLTVCPNGLPPICGFGYRGQIAGLAEKISGLIGTSYSAWSEVLRQLPVIQFLMPDDMSHLEAKLKQKGLNILRMSDGTPAQIGS